MTTAQVGLSCREVATWVRRQGIKALGREPGVGPNLSLGLGTRIQVRFAGETEPVGIRPHLVRVIR